MTYQLTFNFLYSSLPILKFYFYLFLIIHCSYFTVNLIIFNYFQSFTLTLKSYFFQLLIMIKILKILLMFLF